MTPSLAALIAVMRQRRSVRAYSPERIPDAVLNACFDLAILAPTSHNLECWQMLDVRDSVKLATLRHLCLDQPAALAAPHLIVVLARPDLWRLGRAKMLVHIEQAQAEPAHAKIATAPMPTRNTLPAKYLAQNLLALGPAGTLGS